MRSAGEVGVLGVDPARGDEAWRARVGVVLQSWRDHGKWRVRELLVHLGRYYAPYGTPGRKRPYDVDELIETVGLGEHAGKKISSLRRPAPQDGRCHRHCREARAVVSGRADSRFRPSCQARVPRPRASVCGSGGHHHITHHPRSRRGRKAGRSDPDSGRWDDHRRRVRGSTLAQDVYQVGGEVEPGWPELRPLRRRPDPVRQGVVQAVRRGHLRPGGASCQPGGLLHVSGQGVRVRTRRAGGARVRGGGRMNPSMAAVGAGIRRGGIELRQTLTNAQDMWNYVFLPTVFLVVMYFLRGHKVPGTDFSLGAMSIPSVIGMQVAFGGLVILATVLIIEREDGTLLRAKATPNGMLGYLVGKVLTVSGMSLVSLAIVLVPGAFLFEGMRLDSLASWSTLAWVLLLGLVAAIPVGAVIGSLLPGPRSLGFAMVPTMGLVATSRIFYPITGFPVWMQ